jgi:CIC family chloride channel protein
MSSDKKGKIKTTLSNILNEHDDLYMVIIAVIIGILAGLGNWLFRYLISFFQEIFYGNESEFILSTLLHTPIYKIILIPTIGGLIVGVSSLLFKFAKGHGVPDVMKAIALNKSISPMIAVIKTFSSAVTLASGGSAGREGPIVQIGAAIGSGVGKLFKFTSSRMRAAIACGGAGGLAATFNAPIGGAMFAAEVLLGEFGIKTFSPIIISSVIATAVSRGLLGNNVTFHAPTYVLVNPIELLFYLALGFVCAVVGVIFIRMFYFAEEKVEALKVPNFLKPAIGGLLLGLTAIYFRDVMGVGYDTILDILHGHKTGAILLVLIFMKMISTIFTLGFGGSGGLFVPALFIGAATGGFFGSIVHSLFPTITASSGAYGLVAMSAMLAATMRAPLTSILIIFEITQSYEIILPLMLSAIIANVAANWMEKDSIFTWILSKQGIKLKKGAEEHVLNSIKVNEVMLKDIVTFDVKTSFKEILDGIQHAHHNYYPVLKDGYLYGVLSLDDLKSVMFEEGLDDIIVAGEICSSDNLIVVRENENLSEALQKMSIREFGALPVVREINDKYKVVGLIRRSDILLAYNKKIMSFDTSTQKN